MSETLYLCLDLAPRAGVVVKPMDPDMPVPAVLTNSAANGPYFERNWRCFANLEAARAHVDASPTLVLIPIVADMVPIEAVQ